MLVKKGIQNVRGEEDTKQRERPRKHKTFDQTMTALERSSMSFRRQGSSGRIWEDRLPVFDRKPSRASFSGHMSDFERHPNFD